MKTAKEFFKETYKPWKNLTPAPWVYKFAEEYAQEAVTSALQEAGEKANIIKRNKSGFTEVFKSCLINGEDYRVDKESILSLIPKEQK